MGSMSWTRMRSAWVVAWSASALGCLTPSGSAGPAASSSAVTAVAAKPIREAAAAAHKRIGTAVMAYRLNDGYADLVAANFDSLSPENEMKWETVEPQPGVFNFKPGDRLVAFAAEKNLRMRGHTLVWHSQLAPWVKGLSTEDLRTAMARHIQNVVGHWKGKVAQWDVVNEALEDGPGGQLRKDSPWIALGPTFIDEAFKLAHAADPDAKLFYNDYEIETADNAKGEAAYQLCKRLKDAGVPIHGVGFQTHYDPRKPQPIARIKDNMARYAALGLDVELTEVDIPVGGIAGTLEQKLAAQRTIAHDLVAACVGVDRCTGVTFWGTLDSDSWLNSPQWAALRGPVPHYPLLFTKDRQPKPAVLGVLDALAGK